jgi:hypothetical protein
VKDAAKNHYEPLRSAFGAFVAETAFIGSCNLFVEGIADQVILAGVSNFLRNLGESQLNLLDLNQLTIVPAGSASHIPYLVFLAVGRDVERPAIIALLDTDSAGNAAKADLKKDKFKRKQLLKPEFILQIGDLFTDPTVVRASTHAEIEIEDLVPIELCSAAIIHFLQEMGAPEVAAKVSKEELAKSVSAGTKTWDSMTQYVNEVSGGEWHFEKVGFARSLISILPTMPPTSDDLKTFQKNMTTLFRRLGEIQREAIRERSAMNVSQRIERARKAFVLDHQNGAKREDVLVLLEDINNALDNTREADEIRLKVQQLRRDFHLEDELTGQVDDYQKFLVALELIRYTARLSSQSE